MADPRELARQAFSMLQSALASSEARAEKLHEELARKPVSKDKLANQVSVLSHRLESIEADCERWRREAEQLEEVLANERMKTESLKHKLQIAESGPEKLTRKEVNYWRANAEKFDQQLGVYKARITALKRELREKEESLEPSAAVAATERDAGFGSAGSQMGPGSGSEVARLQQQIADLNAALADAHGTRDRLESQVATLRGQLEESEHDVSRTSPSGEGSELERLQADNAQLRSSLQLSEASLHDLRRAREDLTAELTRLRRQADEQPEQDQDQDQEREHQLLAAQLEEARSREASLHAELEATRQALAEREQHLPAGAIPATASDDLQSELERARQESADLRRTLDATESELAELRDARESLAAELAEAYRRLETDETRTQEQDREREALIAELDTIRQREAALRAELDDSRRDNEGREEATQALNDAIAAAESKASESAALVEELKAELKEEKEYSENLSELANSRQDEVSKLQDSVEEARERLDDALWRLGKAQYFERLVARRKRLIASLIATVRSKNKAMVALKAGIDSLRTHKAVAEETQHKLLVRFEALKNELAAAKQKIKTLHAEAATAQQSTNEPTDDVAALQERLRTQVELIQSLEEELKTAKAFSRNAAEKSDELVQLQEELDTKNSIISRLQSDIDEQQRKLAKLRGSDSETSRLRAITEQDRSKIDVLERENAELRAMIESGDRSQAVGDMSDDRETELQAKIAELTEAVAKWKRKYEFLSKEAPAAYQNQAAEQ